jgi:hypothetical protein
MVFHFGNYTGHNPITITTPPVFRVVFSFSGVVPVLRKESISNENANEQRAERKTD